MNEEFIKYLGSIGMTDVLCKRVETIYNFYIELQKNEINDIFVSDYFKEDGERIYSSLWFFNKDYCMEAKEFVKKDDFDIAPIGHRMEYLDIQRQDFDMEQFSDKSRLYIKFVLDVKAGGELKAAKDNCLQLKNILIKYLLPNLKK